MAITMTEPTLRSTQVAKPLPIVPIANIIAMEAP